MWVICVVQVKNLFFYCCLHVSAVFAANIRVAFPLLLTLTVFVYAEINAIISKWLCVGVACADVCVILQTSGWSIEQIVLQPQVAISMQKEV